MASSDDGGWRRWLPPAVRRYVAAPAAAEPGDWTQYVPEQWRAWLDASPAPRPQTRTLRFIGVDEPEPGPRWQSLFAETWPAYGRWWLEHGADRRPTRA
ncbi:MAG: hypothetical protein QOI17_1249, partial [Gaiellales bacterium]|nr:hypothetical protein [Gaiellales bacterium]